MKTNGYDGSRREMEKLIAQARVQRAMAIAELISDGITYASTVVASLWKKRAPSITKRALAPR
ncbi:MAG TPA: hypothetical protein VFP36_13490 [Usitatibacter sp.]|nr:hypothetical protein [Usitatibacter sp.]